MNQTRRKNIQKKFTQPTIFCRKQGTTNTQEIRLPSLMDDIDVRNKGDRARERGIMEKKIAEPERRTCKVK
jgi:hypothetical protein